MGAMPGIDIGSIRRSVVALNLEDIRPEIFQQPHLTHERKNALTNPEFYGLDTQKVFVIYCRVRALLLQAGWAEDNRLEEEVNRLCRGKETLDWLICIPHSVITTPTFQEMHSSSDRLPTPEVHKVVYPKTPESVVARKCTASPRVSRRSSRDATHLVPQPPLEMPTTQANSAQSASIRSMQAGISYEKATDIAPVERFAFPIASAALTSTTVSTKPVFSPPAMSMSPATLIDPPFTPASRAASPPPIPLSTRPTSIISVDSRHSNRSLLSSKWATKTIPELRPLDTGADKVFRSFTPPTSSKRSVPITGQSLQASQRSSAHYSLSNGLSERSASGNVVPQWLLDSISEGQRGHTNKANVPTSGSRSSATDHTDVSSNSSRISHSTSTSISDNSRSVSRCTTRDDIESCGLPLKGRETTGQDVEQTQQNISRSGHKQGASGPFKSIFPSCCAFAQQSLSQDDGIAEKCAQIYQFYARSGHFLTNNGDNLRTQIDRNAKTWHAIINVGAVYRTIVPAEAGVSLYPPAWTEKMVRFGDFFEQMTESLEQADAKVRFDLETEQPCNRRQSGQSGNGRREQ